MKGTRRKEKGKERKGKRKRKESEGKERRKEKERKEKGKGKERRERARFEHSTCLFYTQFTKAAATYNFPHTTPHAPRPPHTPQAPIFSLHSCLTHTSIPPALVPSSYPHPSHNRSHGPPPMPPPQSQKSLTGHHTLLPHPRTSLTYAPHIPFTRTIPFITRPIPFITLSIP